MITVRASRWPLRAVGLAILLGGCRQGSASVDAATTRASTMPVCNPDSLHPVTVPPAAGLWIGERSAPKTRVAAMVGPASADDTRPRITRRVESLELSDGASAIRAAADTVSMKLELLPPFGRTARPANASDSHPAAVYAITPLVLLASYEPCDASAGEPRIRYLRRDDRGVIATDLMLRRESADMTILRSNPE